MLKNRTNHLNRGLAQSLDGLRDLHTMCREGRLYEVEDWINQGKPLQLDPEVIKKGTRPKTALQYSLESGQHSLVLLLLRSGYRLELERYSVLDLALESRRWDLFDLLLEWGADMITADVYTVLDTYQAQLYERFYAAGYDLTQRHELGSYLGHNTSNRPLLGFVKRHRKSDPKIQMELNIALGCHVSEGNEKGISLCLWAGADPHAPAPDPRWDFEDDEDSEDDEESVAGWTAIEEATHIGHLDLLKRFNPNPERDDFDDLYKTARSARIIEFLCTIRPPENLTSIISSHICPGLGRAMSGGLEAILSCGVQWSEDDFKELAFIRRDLLKLDDYDLKRILSRLRRSDVCVPETFVELTRTPKIQERMKALRLRRKSIVKRDAKTRRLRGS